ncbi:MAG TPA: ribonuclease HII [Candidatus Saccharimonadales bacterium]|jgi:ribonuclease HII
MVVGIDEVGRGPWAGPLVFGAVVLGDASIEGLTDSKKLTAKRREALSIEIHEQAAAVGLGWVSASEIDEFGLSAALRTACRRALEQITAPYTQIILDGTVNFLSDTGKGPYVTTMKQADLLVPSVSAASIVAKVARDAYMIEQDAVYPGYGFSRHVGYGTTMHQRALKQLGTTPLHRMSFKPLGEYVVAGHASDSAPPTVTRATTTKIGNEAEDAAANYLLQHGYRILERNWKTKACEIDIIAQKGGVTHFVEVKYRKTAAQGGGLAAITPAKLRQMDRAARFWFQRYGETNAMLSAIEVTGADYDITAFLEQVRL